MADISFENVSSLIGKPVIDEMQNKIGKILSFIIDSNGKVSEVLIKDNIGEYRCNPVDRLIVGNDAVISISEIDKTVQMVSERIPLLWRKKKILEKLLNEDKILLEIYEDLDKNFGEALGKLKAGAQGIVNELDKQINTCEEIFKTLHLAKTYLEIEYEIGHVDEDAYRESLRAILNGLTGLVEKKHNLREKREALSNILLGEDSLAEGVEPEEEEIGETPEMKVPMAQEDVTRKPPESEPVITVHMK